VSAPTAVAAPVLSLRDVVKRFGGIAAVNGVSFDVEPGAIVGLVGPNGAGKTTLLNVVSGFDRATEGRVEFDGSDATRQSAHRLARSGLVRTFQHAHVFPTMPVREALVAACHIGEGGHRGAAFRSLLPNPTGRAESRELVEDVMTRLRLGQWADVSCKVLPYGIKKRLGIGFAMVCRPTLLLLDEPAAGLNSRETSELVEDIKRLNDEGLTLIVVEHNMPLIMTVSHKVVVLDHGAMMAEGTPAEIARDEKVVGAYLGRR
jgi:branched-chain amino acid transport system ATP-binding protein